MPLERARKGGSGGRCHGNRHDRAVSRLILLIPPGVTVRHTKEITARKRHLCSVLSSFASRHSFLRRSRIIVGVCRLIANHRHLAFFKSTSVPSSRSLIRFSTSAVKDASISRSLLALPI